MKKITTCTYRFIALLLAAMLLGACSEEAKIGINTDPVAFHDGDECHVCGMLITQWPGAKGQSINQHNGETHKFCSTVDMFSWLLQPENRTLQASVYVHDMAKTHWDHPDDGHLIDGKTAWYVVGSDLQGAMGPSLASYSDKAAAEKLASQRGGRVLSYSEISLEVLQEIAMASHEQAAEYGDRMQMMHNHQPAADGDEHQH